MTSSETGMDSAFDLSRMINPVESADFQERHWEREPLIVHREDPSYYSGLLSLDDVDRLLMLAGPSFDTIRVVVNGNETPISQLGQRGKTGAINTLEAIYDHYRSGSTIVLNSLDERWEPLQRLTRALGAEISANFQVNVYLTPGGNARGFKPHFDTHDVFVAQVHGSKRWRLYGAPYELPLRGHPHSMEEKPADDATPEREFVLQTGDMLYLPRGVIHAASSNDSASVHLTIGMHQALWSSVFQSALTNLFERDARFRRSLPMGFANSGDLQKQAVETLTELVGVLHESLNPEALVDGVVAEAMSFNTPSLRGHLTDLERLRQFGPTTQVTRRQGILVHLTKGEQSVVVHFHNKKVELPAQVAGEVEYLLEAGGPFAAADIPGGLDEAGRMVLIQTFIREGLLTL